MNADTVAAGDVNPQYTAISSKVRTSAASIQGFSSSSDGLPATP
jgi:hypothetical protein